MHTTTHTFILILYCAWPVHLSECVHCFPVLQQAQWSLGCSSMPHISSQKQASGAQSQVEGRTHEVEPAACGEITVCEALESAHSFCLVPACATTVLQAPPSAAAPACFFPSPLNCLCSLTVQSVQQKTSWVGTYLQIGLCARGNKGVLQQYPASPQCKDQSQNSSSRNATTEIPIYEYKKKV